MTVAALLSRTGDHEVTVIEQTAGYGAAGYGLGLYPLGGAVFNALGKSADLRDASVVLKQYSIHGPDGDTLQSVDLDGLLRPFGPMLGVSRSAVIEILASCVPASAIRFGVRAQSVELDDTDTVTVKTAAGESYSADVVIAADGMHSALRQSLFGDMTPHDTGFDAWMWWAPLGDIDPEQVSEYWGPSAFIGLYPIKGAINVAVAVPRDRSPEPSAQPVRILAHLHEHVAAQIPSAGSLAGIWEVGQNPPFLWRLEDVRAPAITGLGDRLALLGDSGIGFLPTAGVGASNALRSAAALAYDLSLADETSAPVAVRRWKQRVEKLVQANQHSSRELAKVMLVKHASSSALVNTIMRHAPVTTLTSSIVKSMEVPF